MLRTSQMLALILEVNPVPRSYVRGFGPEPQADQWRRVGSKVNKWFEIGACPSGKFTPIRKLLDPDVSALLNAWSGGQNSHPERAPLPWQPHSFGVHSPTHVRDLLWYGVNIPHPSRGGCWPIWTIFYGSKRLSGEAVSQGHEGRFQTALDPELGEKAMGQQEETGNFLWVATHQKQKKLDVPFKISTTEMFRSAQHDTSREVFRRALTSLLNLLRRHAKLLFLDRI